MVNKDFQNGQRGEPPTSTGAATTTDRWGDDERKLQRPLSAFGVRSETQK